MRSSLNLSSDCFLQRSWYAAEARPSCSTFKPSRLRSGRILSHHYTKSKTDLISHLVQDLKEFEIPINWVVERTSLVHGIATWFVLSPSLPLSQATPRADNLPNSHVTGSTSYSTLLPPTDPKTTPPGSSGSNPSGLVKPTRSVNPRSAQPSTLLRRRRASAVRSRLGRMQARPTGSSVVCSCEFEALFLDVCRRVLFADFSIPLSQLGAAGGERRRDD